MKKMITSKLNLLNVLMLIPLIIFGFYKNGISLYLKNYVGVIEALKPIILIFMSISGCFLGSIIKEKRKNGKITLAYVTKCKEELIESIIFACILPIKSSPVIVFLINILVFRFIDTKKINRPAFMYLIVSIINRFLGLNIFNNAYELSNTLNYNNVDLFLGYGAGGICSTNIFIILISLLALSFNKLYKRDISLSAVLTFTVLILLHKIIGVAYTEIFSALFSYNILFAFVFMAPNLHTSAYTVKGQVLSGILIACLTFALSFITPYNSAIIAILCISFISSVIDRIYVIK